MPHFRDIEDYFPSSFVTVSGDTVVFNTRGILHSILVVGVGGASGATIRRGVNALGEPVFPFKVLSGDSIPMSFPEPLYFENGCFIDVDDGNVSVTVQYSPLPGKLSDE